MFDTRVRAATVLVACGLLLVGCSASADDSDELQTATDNCVLAYESLPYGLEVLSEQTGKEATPTTPCDNWIESQGEADFIDFWTDPSEYIPYVINSAKVDALGEAGLGD